MENTSFEHLDTRSEVVRVDQDVTTDAVLWFVEPGLPQRVFVHTFRCVSCDYGCDFLSLSPDPDDVPHDAWPWQPARRPGSVLGLS